MRFPVPQVVITKHLQSTKVCIPFAGGCGSKNVVQAEDILNGPVKLEDSVATYGILRGSGRVIKSANDFWYIDNGYFNQRGSYYRVCHNCHIDRGDGDYPKDRFNHTGVKLKDWRKTGSHIVLCPPSPVAQRHFEIGDNPSTWTLKIISELKQYTDRDIVVSTKYGDGLTCFTKTPSKNPFREIIKNAWAVVTFNSNTMVDSLIGGVPVISLTSDRKVGSLEEIENPIMDRAILYNLAYRQWTLKAFASGQAWRELNDEL